jgi:hypothetical protein
MCSVVKCSVVYVIITYAYCWQDTRQIIDSRRLVVGGTWYIVVGNRLGVFYIL